MYKKLITACLAVTALAALIGPATASATNDPTLTDPKGTDVAVGAKIVGTNVGDTLFTNTTGTTTYVTCSKALMTGEVKANSGGTVEGTITTADFWGTGSTSAHNNTPECTSSLGNAYITVVGDLCIRSTPAMLTHEFQVHKGTCGGAQEKVTFIIGSTTIGACKYLATGNIKGDYKTDEENALTVRNTSAGSGAELEEGSFFCPSSGALKMTFQLTTEDHSTPVTIS